MDSRPLDKANNLRVNTPRPHARPPSAHSRAEPRPACPKTPLPNSIIVSAAPPRRPPQPADLCAAARTDQITRARSAPIGARVFKSAQRARSASRSATAAASRSYPYERQDRSVRPPAGRSDTPRPAIKMMKDAGQLNRHAGINQSHFRSECRAVGAVRAAARQPNSDETPDRRPEVRSHLTDCRRSAPPAPDADGRRR